MKLKDYLHYYMGATFITDNSEGEVNPVTLKFIYPMIEKGKNVQLQLRRLEDMTEEEMIELFQSMVPDDMEDKPANDEFAVNVFRGDGGNLVDENVAIGAEYSCRCFEGQLTIKKCGTICAYDEAGDEEELVNAPRAYHYLLQHHFDLFGLIPSGLAIDTKTLTP